MATFSARIKDFATFDDCIIVVFNWDDSPYNTDNYCSRNVICIDVEGNQLWQIPDLESRMENCPYVSVQKIGNNAKLTKFDSTFVILEPKTCCIKTTPIESMKERRLW